MKRWLHKSGWRLLPGLVALGFTLMATRLGIMQPLEQSAYHALFHIRGEQPWDDRVAVVEIDDASLAAIGQFPWPRHYYTQLLGQIDSASVIAFDILFAESSEADTALAKAMAHHGNVVVATAWDGQRQVIGPNANVLRGAIATGHIHHHIDTDGITRAYQPKVNGTLALSVLAVQQHYGNRRPHSADSPNADQTRWLNWPGSTHRAPRHSFIDVVTGKVPGTAFTNKIVFIGFTGIGLDTMATPYNQNPPAAGVYQHVVAANNLLTQNHLRPRVVPVWIVFGGLSLLVSYGMCSRYMRLQSLMYGAILAIWSCIVVVAFNYGYWLPTVTPMVSMALTSPLVRITKRLRLRPSRQSVDSNRNLSLAFPASLTVPISMTSKR